MRDLFLTRQVLQRRLRLKAKSALAPRFSQSRKRCEFVWRQGAGMALQERIELSGGHQNS
jgi:hypothetical protein